MDPITIAIATSLLSPFITKGLAYIMPPSVAKPIADTIVKSAVTKAGFSPRVD